MSISAKSRSSSLLVLILITVYFLTFLLAPIHIVLYEIVASLVASVAVYFRHKPEKLVKLARYIWAYILYIVEWRKRRCQTEYITGEINMFVEELNSFGIGSHYQIGQVICDPDLPREQEGPYIKESQWVILKIRCDGRVRRIMVKIALYFFELWTIPDPTVLGADCFEGLSYMMAEDFFSKLNRPDLLGYLHQNFTEPFVKQNPEKAKCITMLREFRKRRLFRAVLLVELGDVSTEREAKKILKDVYRKVVGKKQGVDNDPTIEGRCTFLMIRRPEDIVKLYSYVGWVKIAIRKHKVRRIYLIATGLVNVAAADVVASLLEEECSVTEIIKERYYRANTEIPAIVMAYKV